MQIFAPNSTAHFFFDFQDSVYYVLKKSKHLVLKNLNKTCYSQTYGGVLSGYTQEMQIWPLNISAPILAILEMTFIMIFSFFLKFIFRKTNKTCNS